MSWSTFLLSAYVLLKHYSQVRSPNLFVRTLTLYNVCTTVTLNQIDPTNKLSPSHSSPWMFQCCQDFGYSMQCYSLIVRDIQFMRRVEVLQALQGFWFRELRFVSTITYSTEGAMRLSD